ncbi:hypothetical protein DFH09DRAFT_1277484 [Mycena vulgaris]|nr:hypothetical protein DFH09DRAFT_1277484 [Mycena vulgaris]
MAPLQSFDPDGTIGALEIGVLVSYVFFGVETTQAYIYYGRFPGDSPKLKSSIFQLGHVISIAHSIYTVSVSDYCHPERLLRAPTSIPVALLFSSIVVTIVQGFFASRIYRLSQALFVPCLCGFLALLRLLVCTFLFISAIHMTSMIEWETQWSWMFTSIWAISSSNDIILAIALTRLLWRHRAQTESKRTIALMDKIIKWTLETGIMTSIAGSGVLITFVTMRNKYIWVAFHVVTAKLYSNALFATLNSRTTLRAMNASEIILDINSSSPARGKVVKSTQLVFAAACNSERSPVEILPCCSKA